MHDLNFDVVKHNRARARLIAEEVHWVPPADEVIALFADASLRGQHTRGGVAVVRVLPPRGDQSATTGEGQTTPGEKPFFLEVVTHELFALGNRPSDCLLRLPVLQVEELELLAILRGFEYAVVEVEVGMLADLATSRLLLWSDCLWGLNRLRLYRAGDSEYWQSYPHTWILRLILECARKLKEYGVYVKCHWVPGHFAVPANEAADYVAGQVSSGQPWNPVRVAQFSLRAEARPTSS
ncbi:hypothetical protein SLS58_005052 [Diplodia intermedia]|uniref:RNase H type-1 domain-containing protein n=1 Tax=Diplodia intermedia TaxID=856260 RepID=A0ABR3TRS7_9PEZI